MRLKKRLLKYLLLLPLFTYWTSWFAIRDSVGDILQITGGHVARVTFKSLIIGENKQHLKRDPQELLGDLNNLKHSLNIPPVLFRTE